MSVEKTLKSKRFVVRKSLIGKNVIITFVNKKGDEITYNQKNELLTTYIDNSHMLTNSQLWTDKCGAIYAITKYQLNKVNTFTKLIRQQMDNIIKKQTNKLNV